MKNLELRQLLKKRDIKQWELAKHIGISEVTLCRHLREELPETTKNQYLQFVEEIAKERGSICQL